MSTAPSHQYHELLVDLKQRIRAAQYEALKTVNKALINLYWDLGRMICERLKGNTWGNQIVSRLSKDLCLEFPGIKGFSSANLWRMKLFYQNYSAQPKLAPLVREISWSHNIAMMEKCRDPLEREFYIRMSRRMGWSKNVLIHQIENKTYEKTLLNQTNFDRTLPAPIRSQAKLSVRDEYVLDFLDLREEHQEKELEQAILSKLDKFLREMGGIFAFVGSQYRLEIEGREYFIDLLLYHRPLQCLVALELKTGDFQPEYIGKLQFYLAALDDRVKTQNENPSIGILLCKSKNKTIVEYALRESRKAIGVAQYRIMSELPSKLRHQLPGKRQIIELLVEL